MDKNSCSHDSKNIWGKWLLANPLKKVADSAVRSKVADRCKMVPSTNRGSGWSSDQTSSESKREEDVLDGITTWV